MPKEKIKEVEDLDLELDQEAEDDLDEASAEGTLKPNGGTGGGEGASRTALIAKMISLTAGMSKEDLTSFLAKTLDQVGKEGVPAGANAGKNKSSISASGSAKPSPTTGASQSITKTKLKEDMNEIFDGQDLTEEFKEKMSTLFEAAVNSRVNLIKVELEENNEEEFTQQVTEAVDELNENISSYLDYVVEKWMEDNELVLESEIRTDITESFIGKLKDLFSEHFVDIPEDKVDLVSEQYKEIENLIAQLEESESERLRLVNLVTEAEKEVAFDDVSEDLADTEVEKLRTLAEGVEYSDIDDFVGKLNIIKKQYFSEDSDHSDREGGLINEDVLGIDPEIEERPKSVSPGMRSYVDAIKRTVPKK